jgi:hypothetical protein
MSSKVMSSRVLGLALSPCRPTNMACATSGQKIEWLTRTRRVSPTPFLRVA